MTGGGDVFLADRWNNRIRKVGADGIIATIAGNGNNGFSGDGGSATDASLSAPAGVAVDGNGNLHIADTGNNRIRMVTSASVIRTIAGTGEAGFSGDGGDSSAALAHDSCEKIDKRGPMVVTIVRGVKSPMSDKRRTQDPPRAWPLFDQYESARLRAARYMGVGYPVRGLRRESEIKYRNTTASGNVSRSTNSSAWNAIAGLPVRF